jgi:hypothetical protein
MPIVVIVEDGTGVADANSYMSVETVRGYAANRGFTLSADDDVVSAQLIRGFDYIEAKECDFQGERVYAESAFPRIGVVINGVEISESAIPNLLLAAQSQLVIAQANGIDIMPNFVAADYVVKEKVGPLETTFADPVLVGIGPKLGAVDAMLAPLFGRCASPGLGLRTVRV